MAEPLDDFEEVVQAGSVQPARRTAAVIADLVPAKVALMSAMQTLEQRPIADLSLEERRDVALLYHQLKALAGAVRMQIETIEIGFKRAMVDAGAAQLPLGPKLVAKLDKPRTTYRVKEQDLRKELLELTRSAPITREEVDEAIHEEISYKPNHTKLNMLARQRGDAIREAIERNRTEEAVSPLSGALHIPPVDLPITE